MESKSYEEFLRQKSQFDGDHGFRPLFMPDFLYDFQKALVDWAIRKGRGAIFADCGLGKTPMQLVWAENVVRKTNKPVLIITPLAVSTQTVREGVKFGIECSRSMDGKVGGKIVVTNYERLHYFDRDKFFGVVCDESGILKNFEGKTKAAVTEFLRVLPYRLLCTATAAPNDYPEFGTSSEALGQLGFMDMLNRFFKNDNNTSAINRFHGESMKWRFKHHAEIPFWRWMSSWARAVRKPSDMGFDDGPFLLPPLNVTETVIQSDKSVRVGFLTLPAIGMKEQRRERRNTLDDRCEEVVRKVSGKDCSVIWCHLNDEGNLLEKIIPDSRQVSGSDSMERKEEVFTSFSDGKLKNLITKPKIGGFGLNWQHCAHMTFFPSHSFEQYYQGVRRCWRFGQKRPVDVDIITTKGELGVLKNLKRKSDQADDMFSKLILHMNDALAIRKAEKFLLKEELPQWL